MCKEVGVYLVYLSSKSIFATAIGSELRFLYGIVISVFLLFVYCGLQESVLRLRDVWPPLRMQTEEGNAIN